jgi:WD40 repeat protein
MNFAVLMQGGIIKQEQRRTRYLAADVAGAAVTADGRRVVSASSDHTLIVWDLDTGRPLRTLEGHAGYVTSVAVMANGKRAVSASWDLIHSIDTVGHADRRKIDS